MQLQRLSEGAHMGMCDAIVRTAGMENLQSLAEMSRPCIQQGNSRDCRPAFIKATARAMAAGNAGFGSFPELQEGATIPEGFLIAPFLYNTKAEIADMALELNVPLHETWSCYEGGEVHCGKCGTCVERLEAITEAANMRGLKREDVDKTEYADTEYWQNVEA